MARKSGQQRIFDAVLEDILERRVAVGDALPTVRDLADRFGTSTSPVSRALAELEERGYVSRRQGSAVRVTDDRPPWSAADSVILGINAADHLFGELAADLSRRLTDRGLMPTLLSTGAGTHEVLQRAYRSDAPWFVLHGHGHNPFELVARMLEADRKVIGIVEWADEGTADRVHRVLVDHALGGELAARWLFHRGHRRALLTGNRMMIDGLAEERTGRFVREQGRSFIRMFHQLGGETATLGGDVVDGGSRMAWDRDALTTAFHDADAPTAVFGLYDFAVSMLQRTLTEWRPALLDELTFVGYGNTPWSRAGERPFASVDLDIRKIAAETDAVFAALATGESPMPPPGLRRVAPWLITREHEPVPAEAGEWAGRIRPRTADIPEAEAT